MWRLAISVMALFATAQVGAKPTVSDMSLSTAGNVLAICEADEMGYQLLCGGYIQGLLDRDTIARLMTPGEEYVCELPRGVTNNQIRAVVVARIKARPEIWDVQGASVALNALKEAFCSRKP